MALIEIVAGVILAVWLLPLIEAILGTVFAPVASVHRRGNLFAGDWVIGLIIALYLLITYA